MLGNTLVHESCRKQRLITNNSTEAELVALSDSIIEGEQVKEFIMDLEKLMDEDFVTNVHLVYQDNQSIIALVHTTKRGKPISKYFKVWEEYVKECLATSELEIEYKKMQKMIAQILTKPIGGEHFHNIAHEILGNHRYACSSNRGAKYNMSGATVELVTTELAGMSCSNHVSGVKRLKTSK